MRCAFSLSLLFMIASCNQKPTIDLLVTNGNIYTVDSSFSKVEAMAIVDGKIIETGTSADLEFKYHAREVLNADDQYIYPGFIDAHAHFLGYGLNLQTADLTGSKSWDEILDRLNAFAAETPNKDGWLEGRGWDQNDWSVKQFPDNQRLNELFPNRPVVLTRIDGHAAIANQRALDLAGIKPGDTIAGGDFEVSDGRLTGILIDNAMDKVYGAMPAPDAATLQRAFLEAQQNCFAVGLTTIVDCGLDFEIVELIDSLQKSKELKMRLYVLLSDVPKNYDWLTKRGILKTERLHVRGFKLFSDGALGSRGACLLEPYSDRPGWHGFLLRDSAYFDAIAKDLAQKGFQMATHAIGDSANRVVLQIYARHLQGANDLRWRIEHAQVVDEADFQLFGQYNVIPSVQPTHATSDMYWATDRLGNQRVQNAYANKELMLQNGWIPLGTDFPVEDISPFKTFYAAVARKDASGWPSAGFQPKNALSREEALRGMTLWAAKASFEEKEKGSLEPGKLADFILLDTDLLKAEEKDILKTRVLKTYVNGERVYGK